MLRIQMMEKMCERILTLNILPYMDDMSSWKKKSFFFSCFKVFFSFHTISVNGLWIAVYTCVNFWHSLSHCCQKKANDLIKIWHSSCFLILIFFLGCQIVIYAFFSFNKMITIVRLLLLELWECGQASGCGGSGHVWPLVGSVPVFSLSSPT